MKRLKFKQIVQWSKNGLTGIEWSSLYIRDTVHFRDLFHISTVGRTYQVNNGSWQKADAALPYKTERLLKHPRSSNFTKLKCFCLYFHYTDTGRVIKITFKLLMSLSSAYLRSPMRYTWYFVKKHIRNAFNVPKPSFVFTKIMIFFTKITSSW